MGTSWDVQVANLPEAVKKSVMEKYSDYVIDDAHLLQQTLVSVRYCVKGWQISTATGATVSFSLGGSLENPAVPVVRKMKKGAFTSEENPKLYKYLERGKGTVCHQWCLSLIHICSPHYAVRFMYRMKMERSVRKSRNVPTI